VIAPREIEGPSGGRGIGDTAQEEVPDISEVDLLKDLRNLIVSEESDRIREILEILNYLRAKLDDPEGLVRTIKPVIGEILAERIHEAPDEMAKILAPVVTRAFARRAREDRVETARALRPVILRAVLLAVVGRAGTGIGAAFQRFLGLFGWRRRPEEAFAPAPREGRIEADGRFGLREVFLLGKDSLLLLAYGTWNPESTHLRAEGRLLPLVRRFIRSSVEEGTPSPLRARFEDRTIIIELGRHMHLVTVFSGEPPVGFLPDLRQALADIHGRVQGAPGTPAGEAPDTAAVRPVLRILLDRYRPTGISIRDIGADAYDPIRYPGPQGIRARSEGDVALTRPRPKP